MYSIEKEFIVEYGHRLFRHKGGCGNIHGHSAKIILELSETVVDVFSGMIIDFTDVKNVAGPIIDQLDHALVLNDADPLLALLQSSPEALHPTGTKMKIVAFKGEPTAENFARWLFELFVDAKLPVASVTFYETAKNCASYRRG